MRDQGCFVDVIVDAFSPSRDLNGELIIPDRIFLLYSLFIKNAILVTVYD